MLRTLHPDDFRPAFWSMLVENEQVTLRYLPPPPEWARTAWVDCTFTREMFVKPLTRHRLFWIRSFFRKQTNGWALETRVLSVKRHRAHEPIATIAEEDKG